MESAIPPDPKAPLTWRERLKAVYRKFKALQGDPHYVAMGVAIGVFVGVTPTIPLHTSLAIGLAFVFRASKPAAALAVWFGNPLTAPLFYYAGFKVGAWILGHEVPLGLTTPTLEQMLKMGWDTLLAMIVGGALIGIIPAVPAYFLTFHLFRRIHLRRAAHQLPHINADTNPPASSSAGPTGKNTNPSRE